MGEHNDRPNRLIHETSPYLLQHAYNPVDWHPWGAEALERARAEDKPIFLSIGYAACHWCHVMEHESFEDSTTAALMNEHFVNVKVDREERPDLDSLYMQAVVALTGHGGWPMSVFLTPEGAPFYGGTYYPPQPRHGLPAFSQVLQGVAEAWRERRTEVLAGAQDVVKQALRGQGDLLGDAGGGSGLELATVQKAAEQLWRQFDWKNPGWGSAPKFPAPMAIEFLLRYHRLTGEATPLDMAVKTLQTMARGGLYDQLGGGFHRYSTDAVWLVPHFEKMLYDNAQLARAYLHAWQVTQAAELRATVGQVLDYVLREMTDPGGGFYSTQDADSEGEEGKFFVWREGEIDALLGADSRLFKAAYGVTAQGNFEHRNILHVSGDWADLAQREGLERDALEAALAHSRQKLFAARERRVHPGLDDKVLAGWNGLMLAAMAEAARVLGRADYRRAAVANAEFLLERMRTPAGRLHRTWRQGQARLNGYLEDYANVAEGLLALYETTFDARYFTAARELMDIVLEHFADPQGGFFDTSDDHEQLVARPKDVQDNATPSGNGMAATVFTRLAAYTGDERYSRPAEAMLRAVQPALGRYPSAFGQWLSALTFALSQPREVAVVGDPAVPATQALLDVVQGGYRPFQVVALKRPGEDSPVPLVAGREMIAGQPTAAVCYNFTCQMPVTDPEALRVQLERPTGRGGM